MNFIEKKYVRKIEGRLGKARDVIQEQDRLIQTQQAAVREISAKYEAWVMAADERQRERDEARRYANALFLAVDILLDELSFHVRIQKYPAYQCRLAKGQINAAINAMPPPAQRYFRRRRDLDPGD